MDHISLGDQSRLGTLPRVAAPATHAVTDWRTETVGWIRTIATAAVYTMIVVTFFLQIARVEGRSMAPTLADHDRLIVNKLVYHLAPPRRGDIVMFYYPVDPNEAFVKRVIAEAGDIVRIRSGRVYVNDRPVDDSYVPAEYRSHEDYGPQRVRAGYYFVLGDHRNDSSDSREWGLVPRKYIIGMVQARWWPLSTLRAF